jgi:hypothetical protein
MSLDLAWTLCGLQGRISMVNVFVIVRMCVNLNWIVSQVSIIVLPINGHKIHWPHYGLQHFAPKMKILSSIIEGALWVSAIGVGSSCYKCARMNCQTTARHNGTTLAMRWWGQVLVVKKIKGWKHTMVVKNCCHKYYFLKLHVLNF